MMVVLYLLVPAAIVSLAIIIAILHMIAPDHWTPIISYAIKNRYTKEDGRCFTFTGNSSWFILICAIIYHSYFWYSFYS
ncbi:hypothetical protein [Acidiplasma cupricumulans]|uniref:hypothetical protein n=1 Tax=Acidiplasma cupricumulans TaxID=312540 RepID=UPI001585A801|nr:hypothetical protein [Acidiplasma cupricumulans]